MNTLSKLIPELRRGSFDFDAMSKLQEVTKAVADSGKPGTVTIKLTIKPMVGDDGCFFIEDSIDIKKPKSDTPPTVVFLDMDGELTREDPRGDLGALGHAA